MKFILKNRTNQLFYGGPGRWTVSQADACKLDSAEAAAAMKIRQKLIHCDTVAAGEVSSTDPLTGWIPRRD